MKKMLILAALVSASLINIAQAADVGVSISIGQPGYYGQIDIGGYPQPRVIYRQPRVVERVYDEREPIYLHVPPGHMKHWEKHCQEYNACGERVYFVNDDWYNREYSPRYQESHREHREEYRDEHHDERRDGRDKHYDDRGDEHHDNYDHEH